MTILAYDYVQNTVDTYLFDHPDSSSALWAIATQTQLISARDALNVACHKLLKSLPVTLKSLIGA